MRRQQDFQLAHISDRDAVHVAFSIERPSAATLYRPGNIPIECDVERVRTAGRKASRAADARIIALLTRQNLAHKACLEVDLPLVVRDLGPGPVVERAVRAAWGPEPPGRGGELQRSQIVSTDVLGNGLEHVSDVL